MIEAEPIDLKPRIRAVRLLRFVGECKTFATDAAVRSLARPDHAASKTRMTVSQTLTVWPAGLRLDQAAEYCGLSVDTFKDKCPVKPIEFTESSRGYRYLNVKLDEWLSSLDPNGSAPSAVRRFGEKTNGR